MTSLRTLLLTCSLSQVGCAPIVYEIVDKQHDTTEDPPGTTAEPTTFGGESMGPSCSDGQWNGEESDLDCGGPCPPCEPGQQCKGPLDCQDQACIEGLCAPLDCQDTGECPELGPCQHLECDPNSGCSPVTDHEGEQCSAEDLCIFAGQCEQGECVGPTLDCSSFAGPCRASSCNPATGNCEIDPSRDGDFCDDGLACTVEQCIEGECSAKMLPQPLPLLFTDFSAPDGWSAQPPWQIGTAIPSKCSDKNANDPSEDHSPGIDEQLAGVLIGDCLPTMPFPQACLTSPPQDPEGLAGELELRYWSVLNTAGMPMESRIDVFDGNIQGWTPLAKFAEFTAEPAWTEHTFDLTPYISPGLRFRFCHSSMFPNPPVGGWSLDDISVGPPLLCE